MLVKAKPSAAKIDNVIVILSHISVSETEISDIGKARVRAAVELFHSLKGENTKVVFTGTSSEKIGCHLNPHAYYVAEYAVSQGLPRDAVITEFALSNHTGEDAKFSKPIVEKHAPEANRVYVVTSKFHNARAAITFRSVYGNGYKIISHSAGELTEGEAKHAIQAVLPKEELASREFTLREIHDELNKSEAAKIPNYFPDTNWKSLLTQKEMAQLGSHTNNWTR